MGKSEGGDQNKNRLSRHPPLRKDLKCNDRSYLACQDFPDAAPPPHALTSLFPFVFLVCAFSTCLHPILFFLLSRLTDLAAEPGLHPFAALAAAAAVERGSEHPIARAIVERAEAKGLKIPQARDFRALPGAGATADVNGTTVTVGLPELFDEVPGELATLERPGTTVLVGWDGRARGALTVTDDVAEVVAAIQAADAARARGENGGRPPSGPSDA